MQTARPWSTIRWQKLLDSSGGMHCRSCRYPIREFDPICPFCRAITSPDGVYRGPTGNAPWIRL